LLKLRVRDRYGALAELYFRIDPGADLTAVPISVAQQEGISFRETIPGVARGLVGAVARFRDRIRIVIAGREHDWPCDFIKEAMPAGGTPRPLWQTSVLGRAGFLDEYAFTIDSGYFILTRLGPIRRWLRRLYHQFWQLTGMVHSPDRPL